MKINKWVVVLALALVLALASLLMQSPASEWSTAQRFGARLQSASIPELLLFILIGIAATAVGLPRQLFAFISGFAFGVIPGVTISLVMAICGCAISFKFSRRFIRGRFMRRHRRLIDGLDALTENDAFWKIVMLRLQPLGTNLLTNLAAGVSALPARAFLTASALGYIPQMVVFALLGSGARLGSTTQLTISLFMLFISLLIGLWLLVRSRVRRASAE